jgi:uncharacterized DUF497 family protein
MPHVRYEWDNGKAAKNLRKHGMDFTDAIAALEDTNRLEKVDTRSTSFGKEAVGYFSQPASSAPRKSTASCADR